METGLVRASVLLRRSHPGGGGDQAQRGRVSHNPSRWRRGSESPPGEMLQHSLICPALHVCFLRCLGVVLSWRRRKLHAQDDEWLNKVHTEGMEMIQAPALRSRWENRMGQSDTQESNHQFQS